MSSFEDKLAEIQRLHESGEKEEGSKTNRLITKILTANKSNLDDSNKRIKEFLREDNVPVDFAYENKQGITPFIAAALTNNVPMMKWDLKNGGFETFLFEEEYIALESPEDKIINNKKREKYENLARELKSKQYAEALAYLVTLGVNISNEFQRTRQSLRNTSSGGKKLRTRRRGRKCGKRRKTQRRPCKRRRGRKSCRR
jgi:ankyrin repeat protein